MALFYTGKRPVTKGRNYNDSFNVYKGTVGTYSNWSLYNKSHVLDGAPNRDVVLGDNTRLSRPTLLEYLWSGGQHVAPMVDPGAGERVEGMRWNPLLHRGVPGSQALDADNAHDRDYRSDYSRYSNYIFDGLEIAEPLNDPGHSVRYTAAWGGASRPFEHQGVAQAMEDDSATGVPEGTSNPYGYNKVNEWHGIPSARAL